MEPAYIKKEDIAAYYENPVDKACGVGPTKVFKLRLNGPPMAISEMAKINQAEHDKAQRRQERAKLKTGKRAVLSA